MSRSDPWSQYLCDQCDCVNFLPPRISHVTTPCARCGAVALTSEVHVEMPKFRANSTSKL